MKNASLLVNYDTVKLILNASRWDFEYSGTQVNGATTFRNKLNAKKWAKTEILEIATARMLEDFNEWYPEQLGFDTDELDADGILNDVNDKFALFIAPDIAKLTMNSEERMYFETYTFFIL